MLKVLLNQKENEQYDDLHGDQLENTAMLDNEMYAISHLVRPGCLKGLPYDNEIC